MGLDEEDEDGLVELLLLLLLLLLRGSISLTHNVDTVTFGPTQSKDPDWWRRNVAVRHYPILSLASGEGKSVMTSDDH